MNRNFSKTKIVCIFFLAGVIMACQEKTIYDLPAGELSGMVKAYDSHGQLTDCSGIEVTTEGNNPNKSATTDDNGNYVLDNLQTGTYNLVFSKTGFCTYKIIGIQFLGGALPISIYTVGLYEKIALKISNLQLQVVDNFFGGNVKLTADISDLNDNNTIHSFRYYLSESPDVTYTNYVTTGEFDINSKTSIETYIPDELLAKFPAKADLYVILYPCTETDQYYTDIETGKRIYSTVNSDCASNVANVVVPEME